MTERKKTILIVDDVPDDILILEEILKGDYQVKAVTNGEAALKIARGENPPDLLLLDVMMPGMDGFEVCRNLKQDAEGAMIPVIFLTAKVMTADEKTGLELGAVDYIRKPVDPDIVRARIKSYLERKDQSLRVSEVRYRRLFETAKDGIIIVDMGTGGIIDVNPSMAALIGLSQEAFLGKRLSDLDFLKAILSQQKRLSDAQRRSYVRYKDLPLETFDGRRIYVEFIINAYQVNHREVMQLNIREITDLVAAESERDDLSARLSHYVSTSPTVTYSLALKDGVSRWRWVSDNISAIFGYSSEEALAPDWWFSNVKASDRAGVLDIISELSRRGSASREYRFTTKDRRVIWVHDEMRLIAGQDDEAEVVGTLTDISARKKAEEELHLKSAALEAAANAIVITDRAGVIRWANPAFETLTGFSSAEAIGSNPGKLIKSGKQDDAFYRGIWDAILSGRTWSGKLVNRKKSGDLYDEEMTITPVLDGDSHASHFIAIKNDVTERELARERLEAALRQKDALLREIHHRVNNNMQVISSLLNLSAHDILDAPLRGKLEDITRRMHAMAIVHEQFYEARDMSRIDFAVYLGQLVESLGREFPEGARRVINEAEAGLALLHLEQAIPAALIASELLTNAMKFAFSDGREAGSILVSQRFVEGGMLELEVKDDGVGLPPELVPKGARSMGMTLIHILTEQLGGSIEFKSGSGTDATLRFRTTP